MTTPLAERLRTRLVLMPETGCLIWPLPGNANRHKKISLPGRRQDYIHRIAWELANGPIPDGLVIDHVWDRGCRWRNCANVAHLEPVTDRVNILRGIGPPAVNSRKTRCPAGHPYTRANTRVDRHGKRHCRECNREQSRNRSIPAVLSHGSVSTYNNYGCRCELCASAMSAYQADYHRRRKAAAAA